MEARKDKVMSDIKPVYQLRDNDSEWTSVFEDEFEWQKIHYPNDCRIVYSVAAYEALKAEIHMARDTNEILSLANKKFIEEIEAQAKRIEELEAATEHLGLTPKQAADGLARYKAQVAEIESLRKRIAEQLESIEATAEFAKAFWEKADKHRATRVMVSKFQQLEQKLRTYLPASKNGE